MLVGREAERELIDAALDRAPEASAALLVYGPPGIGKTTLLAYATERARRRGFDVVTARPTRAESPLAFAALADLLHGADLDVLATAEREAIATALGRRSSDGIPPQTHVLGFALVDLLDRRVNAGTPVLVVVDDIQWADAASRDVLAFAMRRLPPTGVCLVVAQRTPALDAAITELFDVPEAAGVPLAPLPRSAVVALLGDVRTDTLPEHIVDRIVAASGGNPLFAAELARAVDPAAVRPGDRSPFPPRWRQLWPVTSLRVLLAPCTRSRRSPCSRVRRSPSSTRWACSPTWHPPSRPESWSSAAA